MATTFDNTPPGRDMGATSPYASPYAGPVADPGYDQNGFGTIDIEALWRMIARRWKTIAAILIACLLAGVVISLLMTRQYTAESRIEISRKTDNVSNVEGVETEDY